MNNTKYYIAETHAENENNNTFTCLKIIGGKTLTLVITESIPSAYFNTPHEKVGWSDEGQPREFYSYNDAEETLIEIASKERVGSVTHHEINL